MSYFALIIISTLIGAGAQWYVRHQIKKYSSVADFFADLPDCILYECIHLPVACTSADT